MAEVEHVKQGGPGQPAPVIVVHVACVTASLGIGCVKKGGRHSRNMELVA